MSHAGSLGFDVLFCIMPNKNSDWKEVSKVITSFNSQDYKAEAFQCLLVLGLSLLVALLAQQSSLPVSPLIPSVLGYVCCL